MDLKDDKVAFQQQMQMALPLDIILRDNPSQCPLLRLPPAQAWQPYSSHLTGSESLCLQKSISPGAETRAE